MELALNDAIRQVRTRLDELSAEETDMMLSSADDRNLETTIEELMPEAIKSVHLSAPLSLLRGKTIDNSEHLLDAIIVKQDEADSSVLVIDFRGTSEEILRLISANIMNNKVTVFEAYSEDSIWGKMQQNKYLRGTPAHPFIIETSESEGYSPVYRYYSLPTKDAIADIAYKLTYFPAPEKSADNKYFISDKLYLSVVNYLTGLVLQTYEKTELAQIYFTRATDAMQQ